MAELFNINNETGDTSQYTSIVDPDTDEFNVTEAAALKGTYGAAITVDDQDAVYGEKTFTQITSTSYRLRHYIDPNELTMANADHFYVLVIRGGGGGRGFIDLHYDGANYEIRLCLYDDAGLQSTAYYDITDASHYVEALVNYATGAEAEDDSATLWIDGASQETLSNLDLFSIAKPDGLRIGACSGVDVGTSGTFYVDELVFRDDSTAIGACSSVEAAAMTNWGRVGQMATVSEVNIGELATLRVNT